MCVCIHYILYIYLSFLMIANLRFVRNQETIEKVEASALSEAAKASLREIHLLYSIFVFRQ